MLGIKKRVQLGSGRNTCQQSMEAYIVGMCEAFKDHIPNTHPEAPFPPGKYLWRNPKPEAQEKEEVLALGYQRAVGMLLWAQRGVYPECSYTTKTVGRQRALQLDLNLAQIVVRQDLD